MRAFSFGGGVQSTAVLVLAAQGQIAYDVYLFADVGEDSENPETVAYVRDVAAPFAARHGLDLVTVKHPTETLIANAERANNPLPTRTISGAPFRRNCTKHFKSVPVARYLKRAGASSFSPATLGLGISLDESQRMSDSRFDHIEHEYPLVDLRIRRGDCLDLIAAAGLPTPPRSACWFCPFHRLAHWERLRRDLPDLYARAERLEETLSERNGARGGLFYMSLPAWWGRSLACGCVRGVRVCPDAEALWDAVADANNPLARTVPGSPEWAPRYARYEAAIEAFEEHVGAGGEEVAIQLGFGSTR